MATRPIALGQPVVASVRSVRMLNQVLADAMFLHALYKKAHWQVVGPNFVGMHQLFDAHASEQLRIIDLVAERVQSLGGNAVGDPRHAAELTVLERPPDEAEPSPTMLARLLDAHARVVARVRQAVLASAASGDWGTNDLLIGDVLRVNERQSWFVAAQVARDPEVAVSAADAKQVPSPAVARTAPDQNGSA
jgi:starvation-inducible DNA-binding protein